MAVKGYTNSELAQKKREKLVKITVLIGMLHLLLTLINVVLAVTNLGIASFVTVVIYIVLFGIYIRGADMLSDEGYEKSRRLKAFKYISVVLYFLSFSVAMFSSIS